MSGRSAVRPCEAVAVVSLWVNGNEELPSSLQNESDEEPVEERWKVELPVKHAVVPWMVEYAALLLNRFEVVHDGRTAYERLKGKRAKCLGVDFGEASIGRRTRLVEHWERCQEH